MREKVVRKALPFLTWKVPPPPDAGPQGRDGRQSGYRSQEHLLPPVLGRKGYHRDHGLVPKLGGRDEQECRKEYGEVHHMYLEATQMASLTILAASAAVLPLS